MTISPENKARNIYIVQEYIHGRTAKSVMDEFGISSTGMRAIVDGVLRRGSSLYKTKQNPPCAHYDPIEDIREHKEYWLKRVNRLAKHWEVEEEVKRIRQVKKSA